MHDMMAMKTTESRLLKVFIFKYFVCVQITDKLVLLMRSLSVISFIGSVSV